MSLPSFGEFVRALHGRDPYAWQERAAAELASDGWWPALRAPTGAGKTTLIDCWLYALATAGPDQLGRRLVWVVDRRSVVDQVHAYASDVMTRLAELRADNAIRVVAEALEDVGGGVGPTAVLWRGGLDDEASIAVRAPLDPAAPAVVVSTVDQLGSRLLFRGYGLGVGSRALHAGLLGVDTTVVLDEAHIAEPLRRLVARVAEIQTSAPCPPRPPLRLCAVSATHDASGAFELTEQERNEPAIAQRIRASKRARLHEGSRARDVVQHVHSLTAGGAKVMGVVLNTVAEARRAFDALPDVDGVLLIGPVRPLDRADLLAAVPDRAQRSTRPKPFVVVSTQTIEVGVDLDFDALISACAPLDALVQRFGRLDREGALGTSEAVVLAPPKRGCPVYGEATPQTWSWLKSVADDGIVDLGVEALRCTIAQYGSPPTPPPVRTIRLLDLHVGALTVTDATDDEGPDIQLLLHGDRRPSAQVAVAWRLLPTLDGGDRLSAETIKRELTLRPLHSGEVVMVSIAALRRWLTTRETDELSDVESIGREDAQAPLGQSPPMVSAWRIRPDGEIKPGRPSDIRPTDRVLVSADAGGVDRFGWAPRSVVLADDLGSLAARGPRVVLDGADHDVSTVANALQSGDLTIRQAAGKLAGPIQRALPSVEEGRSAFSDRIGKTTQALLAGRASLMADGNILVVGRGARSALAPGGGAVALERHQAEVDARATGTLGALRIEGRLATSVRRAARHHDEGKRDPRFQAWLRGGQAAVVGPLAKSAYPYDPARIRRLRETSGWPAGKRHELVSAVAVAHAFPDDELAAWLVATHHGRNRPFPAAVEDSETHDIAMSIGGWSAAIPCDGVPPPASHLSTFVALSRKYGTWGLAFLEAIVVSADRTVSAHEGGS